MDAAVTADSNSVLNSIRERIARGVPTGWRLTTLGECFKWSSGGTPRRTDRSYFGGDIPWAVIGDLSDGVITETQDSITQAGLQNSSAKWVEPGSVLVAMYGSIGKLAIAGRRLTTNQAIAFAKPDPVDPKYLYYYLLWQRPSLARLGKGATQLNISQTVLKEFPFVLAPADDQRRIVAEIEKQFSRLDEAVAALTRAIVAMNAYRASVLEAAIRGQLVRETRPTSASRLDELIGQIHQGWSPKCDLQREPGPDEWAVITTTAVQPMKYLDNQGKPLPTALKPRPQLEIQPGDFLVTRKGPRARAGVACLVRQTRRRLMVCDTVYRFRCDESRVVPDYLEIALNAPSVVQAIDRQKAGINESGVSLTHQKLGGIAIPVPSREAQQRIVAEVDRRLSIVREVEAEVDANLKRAHVLRQTVLAGQFSLL